MSSIPQRLEQETTVTTAASAAPVVLKKNSLLGDYFQLFKVRVTSLVVMTAWTGLLHGRGQKRRLFAHMDSAQCAGGNRRNLRWLGGLE